MKTSAFYAAFYRIISIVNWVPLAPPPWARLVPFVIDVGPIFVRGCYQCHFPFIRPAECARPVSVRRPLPGARRARLRLQVPVSFCQVLELQILEQ